MTARRIRAVCFDWGGTLMAEDGPSDVPMALWPEVHAMPGAAAALAALYPDYRLCIATNASVSRRPLIQRALARVGLERYVETIFCYTELGVRKESPEFWHAVSSGLGVGFDAIAMLGDTLECDVRAPRALGIHAAWFDPGLETGSGTVMPTAYPAAVPVVASLAEFVVFVRALG